MKRGRWLFLALLAVTGVGLAAAWYGLRRDRGSASVPFVAAGTGGYVEGMAGQPQRVNPLFAAQNAADATLTSLVFAGLTRLDDHGSPFPDLAETWSVSPDGRVYTVRLRQGLAWQDGLPLTADDVLFTYRLLQAPELHGPPPDLARLLSGATLSRVDARTLTIELPQPYAPLPAYLTLGILPAHLLQNVAPGDLYDAPFNTRPVGAGPYRLEALAADRAVLTANPYNGTQAGLPRLELRFYRDDGALFAGLQARQVDAAFFAGGLGDSELGQLRAHKELRLTELPTNQTVYVYLNLKLPLFQDRRVRQALLYAVNRDAVIEDALDGEAQRADSPLAPGSWAYTPSLQRYEADASTAGALLDDAGWKLTSQGTRVKDGQTLQFTLAVNNDPGRIAVAQAVAERWTAIGVRVSVAPRGSTSLLHDLLAPRSFEAVLFGDVPGPDPDPYPEWHSSQTGPTQANLSSLNDPRFDQLLDQARGTATQPQRKQLYAQFQELFAQEVPAIPLYAPSAEYVQPAALQGVQAGLLTDPGARFWQVQDWSLSR